MVDVHAPQPLLPLPFNNSLTQNPQADFTWPVSQDWSSHSSHSSRRPSGEYWPSRIAQDGQGGPYLPYPSPKSLPRGGEPSMTVNAPMSTQHSQYPNTRASVDYKSNGSLSNAVHHDITQARQHLAGQSISRVSSKPASPVFQQPSQSAVGNSIVSYLQLPATITTSEGSLSEFAAQLTCLFWFESSTTVSKIENADLSPFISTRFIPEAYPATGFMKWVTTILSTTQVTQNVILLALLFIYRLKKQCPSVKGKLGSEYRLLTVALMLGNKFLDDNTYTNKTWAEVSGISVHEIHVMEVEFLSHMKYNLYTSKEQWDRWHLQLSKFWKCFDEAGRKQSLSQQRSTEFGRPSLHVPQPLPSPPASTHASPPYAPPVSPGTASFPTAATFPLYPSTSDYAQQSKARKRSYDDDLVEPPAKRPSMQAHPGSSAACDSAGYAHLPALAVPNGPSTASHQTYANARAAMAFQPSMSTGRNATPAGPYLPSVNWLAGLSPGTSLPPVQQQPHHSQVQAQMHSQLPAPVGQLSKPRNPSMLSTMSRTASTGGYPTSGTTTPSAAYPPVSAFNFPSHTANSAAYSANSSIPYPPYNLTGTGSSSMDPYSVTTPHHVAPGSAYPPSASHTLQPKQLSPSHYLTSRSSPYRPVRNMSTLLVAPQSTSIPQHPGEIAQDQMRWQPLGKNVEEQRGRVPYLHREAWPQTHQFDQWPSV